jgi:hypothetical protein
VTSSGWLPLSEVTASFHSTPVTLGTLTAAGDGTVQGSFSVPANAGAGAHTVELTGTNAQGSPQTATASITVVSTEPVVEPNGSSSSGSPVPIGTTSSSALSFTGGDVKALASWSILIIAAGLLLLDVAHRRRLRS